MRIQNKVTGMFLTIKGDWRLWTAEGTEFTQTEVNNYMDEFNHSSRLVVVGSEMNEPVECKTVNIVAVESVNAQPVNLQFFASNETNAKYNQIIAKIDEARKSGNKRQLTLWRNKLTKWQLEYGAYSPIR